MPDYLFQVRISRGRNHPEWVKFHHNVTQLNAKVPDFAGIDSVCVLKHHVDADTVQILCSEDMSEPEDVTVQEVTRGTLENEHQTWRGLIDSYFRPHGSFPNL